MAVGTGIYLATYKPATHSWMVTTTHQGKVRTWTVDEWRGRQVVSLTRASQMIEQVVNQINKPTTK